MPIFTGESVMIKGVFMDIQIRSCIEGARMARGVTVVIDVFRASNTIIACLGQGAKYVIPVGELQRAYRLKKEKPGHLLIGERNSQTPEGFDFGNSPSLLSSLDLKNKRVIATTSAGTQGIVHATGAEEILVGSFANAGTIVEYIRKRGSKEVTLAAMGFASSEKAEEDEQCALYIKQKLEGKKTDFERMKAEILKSRGADRLRSIGCQEDLDFALKLDLYTMVPYYDRQTERILKI